MSEFEKLVNKNKIAVRESEYKTMQKRLAEKLLRRSENLRHGVIDLQLERTIREIERDMNFIEAELSKLQVEGMA
jgi:predicted metal-binding transcription factor (methanogenesis marker protein 9)